jgi:hypothetical protein
MPPWDTPEILRRLVSNVEKSVLKTLIHGRERGVTGP